MSRIWRVAPNEEDLRRPRRPADATWCLPQSATSGDAPAVLRVLALRERRGPDAAALDGVRFGYLISRVAKRDADGGQWTLKRSSHASPD